MLLGFKSRFEPFIVDGSKTHTIRGDRADGVVPKVGETLHCYVNPRQKTMRLLGRWPCACIQDIKIEISQRLIRIWIGDSRLDADEVNELAWRDGFRFMEPKYAGLEMQRFWRLNHGLGAFSGHIIHWDFSKPLFTHSSCELARLGKAQQGRALFQRGQI